MCHNVSRMYILGRKNEGRGPELIYIRTHFVDLKILKTNFGDDAWSLCLAHSTNVKYLDII